MSARPAVRRRAGRPRVPAEERRSRRVNVMLTPGDADAFAAWAVEERSAMGELARRVIVGALRRRERRA